VARSKVTFVDTNVFLRYLTNDLPDQADKVERLLALARDSKAALTTSVLVIAEVVWVLESYYDLPKADIANLVLAILSTEGLKVERAELVLQAVRDYTEKNIDFADAYNGAWALDQGISTVATFDAKHFDRIEGLKAVKP
jgi:predicted nucleic-acid-binding protein